MSKHAVVTIAIGNAHSGIFQTTGPSIQNYAERIGADFIVLDKPVICGVSPHYEKFQIKTLLEKYTRILYLDCDLIVRHDCPNLFEVVPENKLGIFNEGRFKDHSRMIEESEKIHNIKLKEYKGDYYNTGVMVISRMFRDLFQKPVVEDIYHYFEQSYLNLKIMYHECEVYDITYKFNRMKLMDEVTGEHRLNSYIIHYAGVLKDAHKIARFDLDRWEQGITNLPKRVVLACGARIGDVVSSEPVIRYMAQELYKDAQVEIVSNQPRVFAHLQDVAEVKHFGQHKQEEDMAYKSVNAMVPQEHPIWRMMSAGAMNTIDFMSILCLRRTLSDEEKQIRLAPSLTGITEALEVLDRNVNLESLVLVHPGKGWPSKTFPIPYWLAIIEGLIEEGYDVGVIGKTTEEQREIGVLDFEIPEEAIDYRELLSLDGLISLASRAPVLISNDSAPIHVAGAFDNHIILIPTCKHPDHVLPMRKGSKYHKACALYKKLMMKDPAFIPSRLYGYGLKDIPEGHDIEEYLPEPEQVIGKVKEIMPRQQS
jgi:hypothetical protein